MFVMEVAPDDNGRVKVKNTIKSNSVKLIAQWVLWAFAAISCAIVAAACVPSGPGATGPSLALPQPTLQQPDAPAPANGRVLGRGPVRVALLVPQTAEGFGALAAENFTNAADLALREFDPTVVNIVVKDTKGTQDGASIAAREALAEGAEVIIGPVFSNNVPVVASVARPSGVPVITFSNSSRVGSRGVYVFGFTPEPGIKRAVELAGANGSRSFAALLPNNGLGTLAEGAFREAVANTGGRVTSILRYSYDGTDPVEKAREAGALAAAGEIDTVFVPDAGDIAPQLVSAVKTTAPGAENVKFVGSGQWDDPRVFRNTTLTGAIYPAPDRSGYNQFASRYNTAFGKPPIRLASLGYDAASLMVVLAQNFGGDRFSESRLTNANGFKGVVDGTFRLSQNGNVDRSLAVYEVTASGPRIISAASDGFQRTAFTQ